MHYMVNGTTPYPLTSYYTSYAAAPAPACEDKGGPLGWLMKGGCDIQHDFAAGVEWVGKSAQANFQSNVKGFGDMVRGGQDAVKDTGKFFQNVGASVGGAGDFLSKYGIYLAAGGGVLAIMMIFMMFRR